MEYNVMKRSKYIKALQLGYMYGGSLLRLKANGKLSNRRFRVTVKRIEKMRSTM